MFSNIEKYYRPKEISYLIAEELRIILVLKAYGFNILKRCGKELKIAVNFMDVDDISFEVECCKTLYNYLYLIFFFFFFLSGGGGSVTIV